MIKIEYNEGINIYTEDLRSLFHHSQLPLKFEIKNVVSKKIIWETELDSFMWAKFPNIEINDVIVSDAKGVFVYRHYWDVLSHGSVFYKGLWFYCKSLINQGIRPKGLVIGTHDGEFGEWVPLVRNFMSDMILVEGSDKQFEKLFENYSNKQGVTLIKNIITPDGNDVVFYEGGAGYTNTIVERVIRYWEKEEIKSNTKSSLSINKLIKDNFEKLHWLHLDVEGLDAKLLFSIEKDLLPKFIIYENFNLDLDENKNLENYLKEFKYRIHSENGISMAIK